MTTLKGILYQSGNIDFPESENEWAFARLKHIKHEQEKRIVMHPEVAPIELTRSPELDADLSPWLDSTAEIINACTTVNLQRRESTLRLRTAVCDIDENHKLIVLVSQEAIDEFARVHWQRIAYFYASRHDGFRFDMGTLISMKDNEAKRPNSMELLARVATVADETVPRITFDATGSHAAVQIVEWRAHVPEGETGLFKEDEIEVRISLPHTRQPMIFLYEKRPEFHNRAYVFSGDKLDNHLRRVLKRARSRAVND